MSTQTSDFVEKNCVRTTVKNFVHTAMVSHRGTPIALAMNQNGEILYSVLDTSKLESTGSGQDQNDKLSWSDLKLGDSPKALKFPSELAQVGYGVVPNRPIDTGPLGAREPFQVLSDGKYVYLFRQSVAAAAADPAPIVNATLLVDRFILSGTTLKLSREIRYQRSKHKTEPESRRDTLSAVDLDGNPFYEPTLELAFVNNLEGGNFSVLLLPGASSEEQRWQIFAADSVSKKIRSFNIRFDDSIVFDTSESERFIQEFIDRYGLTIGLVSDIQREIKNDRADDIVADTLLRSAVYQGKGIPQDALAELVYTVRTGVIADDFKVQALSNWPLIAYDSNGRVLSTYTTTATSGVLKPELTFQAPPTGGVGVLAPQVDTFEVKHGMSSCYYYQQELGDDQKPMKTRACVMLAAGMQDRDNNKVMGILNFSVASSGRLSAITTDAVTLPDINLQALDENPVRDLSGLPDPQWQLPQPMNILDIDPNGLSTSGGVLRFAYTSAQYADQYSDATEAYAPHLFDDSLGRVNLYFRGKNHNFFVLYFDPQGSRKVQVTSAGTEVAPLLSLSPRLDRDMTIDLTTVTTQNCCTLTLNAVDGTTAGRNVETWSYLPVRVSQVASILNGEGSLPLATLDPLGIADNPTLAYQRPASGPGVIRVRTDADNRLVFQNNAHASRLADGASTTIALSELSPYLSHNPNLSITQRSFALVMPQSVVINTALFFKSYLAELVDVAADIDRLWGHLKTAQLIQETADSSRAHLRSVALTGSAADLDAKLSDAELDKLSLEVLSVGNTGDKAARRAGLRQALRTLIQDVAQVRILSLKVNDTNTVHVDALQAGMQVNTEFDYAANFRCDPTRLGGTTAPKWEHARSYLFNARVASNGGAEESAEVDGRPARYTIHNAIGQWMAWDASLALQFTPTNGNGALVSLGDTSRLPDLGPTTRGLSVEAWVKPSQALGSLATIVSYKNGDRQYALALERPTGSTTSGLYGVATLGGKRYKTKSPISFLSTGGKEIWRHLAFTHEKFWGYQLASGKVISCGNDSSLVPDGEFSIEILVKIDHSGTLVSKKRTLEGTDSLGYGLKVTDHGKIVFSWEGLSDVTAEGQIRIGAFYKITLIRSRTKPATQPSKTEYPLTGGSRPDSSNTPAEKWYAGKSGDDLLRGMAEKQDQLESKVSGGPLSALYTASDATTYYHSVIVRQDDGIVDIINWTSPDPTEVPDLVSFGPLRMGGDGFAGTFAGVRLWQRALTVDEARNKPVSDNQTGLVAHWRFSEGKDRYVYDIAGEHHGSVEAATGWTNSPDPGVPGELMFYVDGSPVTTAVTVVGVAGAGTPDQLCLGGVKTSSSGVSSPYSGVLEEVRIWDQPRTAEQISDNAFGRLKGEFDQLLANYTFDTPMRNNVVSDASSTSAHLTFRLTGGLTEILSTAPVATEIPQIRSALTGVVTDYHGKIHSRPAVVEYGDVQPKEDGTLDGLLKRCYSFVEEDGTWTRMTGYKVGDLVSQWFGQAQFAPQVVGYLEGPPPLPGENFPIIQASTNSGMEINDSYGLSQNTIHFRQAEEVSYTYTVSKEAGNQASAESEGYTGAGIETLIAPLGFGVSIKGTVGVATTTNWETNVTRSQSFMRGTTVSTERTLSAMATYYDNQKDGDQRYWQLGNIGFALVKSKTADVYLLRLAHNDALVSVSWRPNPDIPEDVNIIPFPINPLYVKQGTLDGRFGLHTDPHYPQAQGAYGQYSYFKPREAYALKRQIEREQMRLKAYFEDAFDVSRTDPGFQALAATTGVAQLLTMIPGWPSLMMPFVNQLVGGLGAMGVYNNTDLREELAKMYSQRSLVDTYVWTVEGGVYTESTQVAEVQQETFSGSANLSLGGMYGLQMNIEAPLALERKSLFGSTHSITLTRSKTREAKSSFGLEVNLSLPTSPRYKYAGANGLSLKAGLLSPGTVDAYRFMSFYLEPSGNNFTELFTKVIDPIWLDQSPDPYAEALRQAQGSAENAKPCWRILHRVTYVSRVLPEFQPEAPPSLGKAMRASGMESNHMLIKRFEPYLVGITNSALFFDKIDQIIDTQLKEFRPYRKTIKDYLALYFQIGLA